MSATFPEYLSVDYTDGENEIPGDYPTTDEKIKKAIETTASALEEYHNPAVMWTGGKDSTLALYFSLQVAERKGIDHPMAVFIDHYQHFDTVLQFVEQWADEWGIELVTARNEDVGNLADEPGNEIRVEELNNRNYQEVREKLEYQEQTFPFLLDTYVGNHLLKTVALNDAIEEFDIDGIISGVRWDEQEARADETFFSPRHNGMKYPPHDRVHPILQFEERDVWEVTWNYLVPDLVDGYPEDGYIPKAFGDLPGNLTQEDIPVSPKYFEGYRSLGSEVSTTRSDDDPAWLQDFDATVERAGRAQDKEDLMKRLRNLGYM